MRDIYLRSGGGLPALVLIVSGCGGGGGGGNAAAPAPTNFTIGGAVSGLNGTGLVLQNNGGGDVSISANSTFAFAATLTSGASYAVTVRTQPTNPAQTCVATNASGAVSSANITNIAITCTTNVLIGVFQNGVVKGLRYQTATQSGFTNDVSEFLYIPGETITFSIGGITLGSTAAKARISPFDFFGLTPPTTEAALRMELASMHNVTNFDRVANIAMLLVALDADSDPTNGLDLTGWHTTLAAATSNFDAPLLSYKIRQLRLLAQEFGLNRNVDSDVPLTLLYSSLGLVVSATAVASIALDDGNNGSTNGRDITDYDAQGRRTRNRYDTDADADGTFEIIDIRNYNPQNRLLSRMTERDSNDNGVIDSRDSFAFTYDSKGFLSTQIVEHDTDANGVANSLQTSTYSNDARGNILSSVTLDDTDANGVPNARSTFTQTFDARGNLLTQVRETDSDANGVANSRRTESNTRDARGTTTLVVITLDNDANGTTDGRSTLAYTYDTIGNVLTFIEEDSDGNGTINRRSTTVLTLNVNGQPLSGFDEVDSDGNGTTNARYTYVYTYDAGGNRLTLVEAEDSDANGSINSRTTTTSTYDVNSNRLTMNQEPDSDANGVPDARTTDVDTYDSTGRKLTETYSYDDDPDGTPEQVNVKTYTYTALSNGLSALLRSYGN